MKGILLSLAFLVTSMLNAAHIQVEGYHMGMLKPDCHQFFVVVYFVDDNGVKWYQGHATTQVGIGCDKETQGVYNMGTESLVDFNDLADRPDIQTALNDWLGSLQLTSFKQQAKGAQPFIYKNAASEFVLKLPLEAGVQLGNVACFDASGKLVGHMQAKQGPQSDEWILQELNTLPKGIYFLIVPVKGSEDQIFERIQVTVF